MTTGKASHKTYKCRNCGHEKSIQTNHWSSCMNHCPSCSWKPSWGEHPGVRMFGTMHRPFDCLEPEPEQIHFAQLPSDKTAIDGTVLRDETGKPNGVKSSPIYTEVTCFHCRLRMADCFLIDHKDI